MKKTATFAKVYSTIISSLFFSQFLFLSSVGLADTPAIVPVNMLVINQTLTGDFSGTGRTDIAVFGTDISFSPRFEVFIQDVGGLFAPPVLTTTSITPTLIAGVASDFDASGFNQIAVLLQKDKTINVYKYQSGSFLPISGSPILLTGANNYNTFTAGNFNGHNGMVAVSPSEYIVVLGDGHGSFTVSSPVSLPGGFTGGSIIAADLDGSGRDSIVIRSTTNQVAVYLNNSFGGFSSPQLYSVGNGSGVLSSGLASGDFNGDGAIDLAVLNAADATVTILLNNGHGSFNVTNTYSVAANGPVSIVAADLDGDGCLDLAIANQSSNSYSLLKGNCNGTFNTPTTGDAGVSPFWVSLFPRKGLPPLFVFANTVSSNITIVAPGASTPGVPTNTRGVQIFNKFLTQTDIINSLSWSASAGTSPSSYKIYRDPGLTQLIATVSGNTTKYFDHNRRKNVVYTYYIVAVGSTGAASLPAVITVYPKK